MTGRIRSNKRIKAIYNHSEAKLEGKCRIIMCAGRAEGTGAKNNAPLDARCACGSSMT